MIYKLVICALLLATIIYYLFCFLEIFGVIKFTDENTTVKIPHMFIPFYYLIHNDKPPVKKVEHRKIKPIKTRPGDWYVEEKKTIIKHNEEKKQ